MTTIGSSAELNQVISSGATAPLLEVPEAPVVKSWSYRLVKRGVDIVVAVFGLVILFPLFLVVGVLIKLTSPGPIFYCWDVIGRGGRPFRGYKFRTMVQDADKLKGQLVEKNEMCGPVFKIAKDPRITPLGQVLRKFSIDELPQLWNVVKGDMSLVGPRPAFLSEWRQYEPWQRRKLSVTPGITCIWQVSGRNEIRDFDKWVRLDLEYIDNWSLGQDFKILAKTIPTVLEGTGQ